jgi:ABC-type polysaccharide/polyol phosphate export permease
LPSSARTAKGATFGYFAYAGAYVPTGWHVLAVLPVLLTVMELVMAISCVTSVLNNIANDTAPTVNYAVSFLLVATPVAYPLDALPKDWQWAFLLNPLTPTFEVWRWALLGIPSPALVVHRCGSCAHHNPLDRRVDLFPALGADDS